MKISKLYTTYFDNIMYSKYLNAFICIKNAQGGRGRGGPTSRIAEPQKHLLISGMRGSEIFFSISYRDQSLLVLAHYAVLKNKMK